MNFTKKKKLLLAGFLVIILFLGFNLLLKIKSLSSLEDSKCLSESYATEMADLSKFTINETYNFATIFNCEDWDELIFVGGPVLSRSIIYLKEGILLPEIDTNGQSDGTVLLFFVKNNKIISNPIKMTYPNLVFSQNLNRFNYLTVRRNNAKFTFKPFENEHFELYTLEMDSSSKN